MKKVTDKQLDEVVCGYIDAALWTTTDDTVLGGEYLDSEYDRSDLSESAKITVRSLCRRFLEANEDDAVAYFVEREAVRHQGEGNSTHYFGHDLWLSSNGHGAGFFDRGLGALGDRLQEAARDFETVGLYIDPDTDTLFFWE